MKPFLSVLCAAGLAACAHLPKSPAVRSPTPEVVRAVGRATLESPAGAEMFDFGLLYSSSVGLRLDIHTTFGIYLATFTLSQQRWDLLLGTENTLVSGTEADLAVLSRLGGILSLLTQAVAVAFPLIPGDEFAMLQTSRTDRGYSARLAATSTAGQIDWNLGADAVTSATFRIGDRTIWQAEASEPQAFAQLQVPTAWTFWDESMPARTRIEIRRIEKPQDVPPSLVRLRAPPGATRLTLAQWIDRLRQQEPIPTEPRSAPADRVSVP